MAEQNYYSQRIKLVTVDIFLTINMSVIKTNNACLPQPVYSFLPQALWILQKRSHVTWALTLLKQDMSI